jgi:hypothetical protein
MDKSGRQRAKIKIAMSARVYNLISNGALLLGIASAFLYDSGRAPNWVAIAMAVTAGAVAVTLYFYNGERCGVVAKEKTPDSSVAVVKSQADDVKIANSVRTVSVTWSKTDAARILEVQRRVLIDLEATSRAMQTSRMVVPREWMNAYHASHHFPMRNMRYAFPKEVGMMTPEVELSPRETAACAIEIIRNLAFADKLNEWEYVFDAKGLRVSMKRGYSRTNVYRSMHQQALNFGLFDSVGEEHNPELEDQAF